MDYFNILRSKNNNNLKIEHLVDWKLFELISSPSSSFDDDVFLEHSPSHYVELL